MNIQEYNQVKNMTYLEYCDYLQRKYGMGLTDYFHEKSWSKNAKCTRTKEGLIAHHKMEDHMAMLSTPEIAKECPFEWQRKHNIIYCDYLEHLLLHALICEYPADDRYVEGVGEGGVVNFIAPELNDVYSGWETRQAWRATCHAKIIHDKDVYFLILERFLRWRKSEGRDIIQYPELYTSFNETFGGWSREQNALIFAEIAALTQKVAKETTL